MKKPVKRGKSKSASKRGRQVEDGEERKVEEREVEVEDQENHESQGRAKIEKKISRPQGTIETQDCGEEGGHRGSCRGRSGRSRCRPWRAETEGRGCFG